MKTKEYDLLTAITKTWRQYDIIREEAANYFDSLFQITKIKLRSSDIDYYEESKMRFVSLIENHFENYEYVNVTMVDEEKLPKGDNLKIQRKRVSDFTAKEIIQTIQSYSDLAIFYISIFQPTNQMLRIINKKYKERLDIYRNRKNKQWREDLYKLALKEYSENKNTDKTKALKTVFELLPDKEKHRKEFDDKFKSILEGFYKYKPKL